MWLQEFFLFLSATVTCTFCTAYDLGFGTCALVWVTRSVCESSWVLPDLKGRLCPRPAVTRSYVISLKCNLYLSWSRLHFLTLLGFQVSRVLMRGPKDSIKYLDTTQGLYVTIRHPAGSFTHSSKFLSYAWERDPWVARSVVVVSLPTAPDDGRHCVVAGL